MGGQLTIADLAARLGISKASVSYALNDQPGVSPETRERVRRLARELGWFPSSSARALSRARTGAIGLVLSRDPELLGNEPFFMRVISGIEQVLIEADVALVLRMVGAAPGRDLRVYERWAGERRVDGVILFDAQQDDPRFPLMERLGLPAVLHGSPVAAASMSSVSGDEADDAARVVDHLHGLGHRHIAHVTGPQTYLHEQLRQRLVGARAAGVGIRVDVRPGDYSLQGARRVTAELLRTPEPPTGIIYGSDLMALGGLDAAAELGVAVPGRLSLVSWDDSILCQVARPDVTGLERHPGDFGRMSATVLLEVIAGRGPGDVVVGPSDLMVRGTSGPAPS